MKETRLEVDEPLINEMVLFGGSIRVPNYMGSKRTIGFVVRESKGLNTVRVFGGVLG